MTAPRCLASSRGVRRAQDFQGCIGVVRAKCEKGIDVPGLAHHLRLLLVAFVGWLAVTCCWAASPSIETVAPGVGQRGTEFELKLVGAGYADAEEALLYRPGVQCRGLKAVSENELLLRMVAADDCPLGSHAFRVRSRVGITELKTFRVTPLPVAPSVEPNDSLAHAQPVERNVTITGVVEAGDVDSYRVSMKRGERLAAEVEAVRLGGGLVDTAVAIWGPDGRRLAVADDAALFRQDPFVTFIVPQDGDYVVQVREASSEGDENSRYALHVGTFPRPAAVYPAGGQAGKPLDVTLLGDAAGEFQQSVALPQAADAWFELFAEHRGQTAPTPQPFRVSPFPNQLEQEPNDQPMPTVAAVRLPVAFNGVIQQPGDVDRFCFQAEAGQRWQFELYGDRLGSPLDAVMSIADAVGEILGESDDYASHDGRIVFDVPTTATYCLRITDKRGAGGPLFVYRVEAATPQQKLTAFMPRPNRLSQEQQTVSVPRGNRVAAYLGVQRVGVPGDVQLQATRLPQGVRMSAGPLSEDRFWMPVVFESASDAPIAGSLVPLAAVGRSDGRTLSGGFEQVVDLVNGPADALYHSYTADRLAVAVTEPAPFQVTLDQPATPLSQDGTLALRIRVEREAGFDSAIDVTFPFLPPWIDGPAKLTIGSRETTGEYVARAWAQAEPRTWPLCAEARPGLAVEPDRDVAMAAPAAGAGVYRSRGRRRNVSAREWRVASQLVELVVSKPPIVGQLPRMAGEQGQTIRAIVHLEQRGPLPEQMTATLEGLPNRVTVEPVTIKRSSSQFEFAVRLEDSAPLGEFTGLACRVSGVLEGQAVSYVVGRGGVLQVEPVGGLNTDADGRPLSRLEVLRRDKQRPKSPPAPTSDGALQQDRSP